MEKVREEHESEYKAKPEVVAMAPGRVHLIGEHCSFFKDKTLSMAVNLPVYVAASKRQDTNLRFYFVQMGERKRGGLSNLKFKKEDKWANAVKSVIYGFSSSGFECGGVDFTIYSNILPSAGFGITTAIKIATAWAVKSLFKFRCGEDAMVKVLEKANKQFPGMYNFRADIFTGVYSKENTIVLTDHARGTYDLLPFKFSDKTILLTDARVPRVTTWNEESLRQPENVLLLGELKERKSTVYGGWQYEANGSDRSEVLSVVNEDVRRHLTCVMNEHQYVLEAQAALAKDDFSGFSKAVNHSHENMRDLYDISCPEIDWLLKRVQEIDTADPRNPVNCGRITGKGFGRCTYTILRNEDVPRYREKLSEYERIFGFTPECFEVKTARGVRLV
ncbi:MAG: galactokinase [Treponema sp.]|nr:galactokinase [Treponema sp.]